MHWKERWRAGEAGRRPESVSYTPEIHSSANLWLKGPTKGCSLTLGRLGEGPAIPTLQGPCYPSQKWRGTLTLLPQSEIRSSSIAPVPVKFREAPLNSTVSLTSQRNPAKLPEVMGTSRPLGGTRRVGGLLGIAGRLSGTVSPFRAEQETSLETMTSGSLAGFL